MKRISSAVVVLGVVLLGFVVLAAVSEQRHEMPLVLEGGQVTAPAVTTVQLSDLPAAELGQPTLAPPRPATVGGDEGLGQGVVCAEIRVEVADSAVH